MKNFENGITLNFNSSFLPSLLGSDDDFDNEVITNYDPGYEEIIVVAGEQKVRTSVDDYILETGDKMITRYDPDNEDAGCEIQIVTSDKKQLLFKPTQSVEPRVLKYDGLFQCGGHCACNDCKGCYLVYSREEADSNPGCHFNE